MNTLCHISFPTLLGRSDIDEKLQWIAYFHLCYIKAASPSRWHLALSSLQTLSRRRSAPPGNGELKMKGPLITHPPALLHRSSQYLSPLGQTSKRQLLPHSYSSTSRNTKTTKSEATQYFFSLSQWFLLQYKDVMNSKKNTNGTREAP